MAKAKKHMKKKATPALKLVPEVKSLRLDLGCGKNPREGFTGVDAIDFGQPYKLDLAR